VVDNWYLWSAKHGVVPSYPASYKVVVDPALQASKATPAVLTAAPAAAPAAPAAASTDAAAPAAAPADNAADKGANK